jgi:hypothetical protein
MLTSRFQIQALADRLAGFPLPTGPGNRPLSARDFNEPWLTCWLALDSAEPGMANHSLVQALLPNLERDRILQSILSARPGYAPSFPSLADLAADLPPIQWLWPGWIPRGMLTVFGASQGSGKSFVALDLAYRIIHSLPFPDGAPQPPFPSGKGPGDRSVLYIDAEMVPQILNERAENYQINRRRLYVMMPDSDEMIDFGAAKYKDRLVDMVTHLRPELVIVDSLSSIHSGGQNHVEDVRDLLSFLSHVATSSRLALLLIHHIRKPGPGQGMLQFDLSMEDLSGSGHITAMARVVIGLHVIQTGPVFDPNGPRQLKMLKTNLGPYEKPLSFEFAPLHPKGVFLKWSTESPEAYKEPTMKDDCVAWLEDVLREAGRPLPPKEVIELAAESGFSRRTVYRARRTLAGKIRNTHGRKHPDNAWELTEPPFPSGEGLVERSDTLDYTDH